MASIPEPSPKNVGISVTADLLNWLRASRAPFHIIELVNARQGLMTEDGRDTMENARQEAGDLLQCIYKAYLQGLKDPKAVTELETVLLLCLSVLGELK